LVRAIVNSRLFTVKTGVKARAAPLLPAATGWDSLAGVGRRRARLGGL
jgi:hypothetical protein